MLIAKRDDALRQLVADSRYVLQQIDGSAIQIHADAVHAGFNRGGEAALQLLLIDVVLILSDADRFRLRS